MRNYHYISSYVLDLYEIQEMLKTGKALALSEEAVFNIKKARKYLDKKVTEEKAPIYGINTGFGSLCNVKIAPDKLNELQDNLVKTHA